MSYVLAATAAASLWFSLGLMAVTGDDTRLRVVALPPFWLLGVAIIVAAAAVWLAKPAPKRLLPLVLTVLLWLPYVPGRVPAWFLIWQGPIEVGVWVLAMAGVLLSRPIQEESAEGGWVDSRRAPLIAAAIAVLAYAGGAVALHDRLPIGDEPHYLMITQSLIKDGDLRIENNHRNRDYAPFARYEIPPHYLTRGTDGEIYSAHAPGVAVLVLPAFAFFGYYGAVATVILCAALASALAWHAAWLLTRRRSAAWIAWAAIFLSAPMFLEAVAVFPDAVAALPVVAGVWLLIALEVGRPAGDSAIMGVGLALAALPWLHTRFVPLAGGLGVVIAWRLLAQGWRRVAMFLAVPAISAALWFGFFWWIWGSPSPLAPWGSALRSRVDRIPSGVQGLLFDPQAGLLVPAPAYILELAGWVVLLRSKPRLAIELAVIGGVLTALVASDEAWWGGVGAPARYLVAALPLFVAPAAWLASRSPVWMRLCTVSVVLSLLMLSGKVYAAGGAFAFTPETGANPLFGWMSSAVAIPSLELKPTASQLTFIQHLDSTLGRPAGRVHLTLPAAGMIVRAQQASRLGDVSVFFMDGRSYPEPTGFWAPGNGETTVVMGRDDSDRNLGLRLQAGPIATSAIVEIDGERQTLAFAARQRHEIAIPPAAAGAWRITIRPGAGFRPVDHNPEIKDYRRLGLWIEVF